VTAPPDFGPVSFDVEAGPYSREYFDSLPLDEVVAARSALRSLQTEERAKFIAEAAEHAPWVTDQEFNGSDLEGADEIYLPDFAGDGVRMLLVDRLQYSRIYDLRDKALIIQSSRPFVDDMERRRVELIDRILANSEISNIETVSSPDNTYFTIYGTVNGTRVRVGQVANPASM
jgi:hypothetical protein